MSQKFNRSYREWLNSHPEEEAVEAVEAVEEVAGPFEAVEEVKEVAGPVKATKNADAVGAKLKGLATEQISTSVSLEEQEAQPEHTRTM